MGDLLGRGGQVNLLLRNMRLGIADLPSAGNRPPWDLDGANSIFEGDEVFDFAARIAGSGGEGGATLAQPV